MVQYCPAVAASPSTRWPRPPASPRPACRAISAATASCSPMPPPGASSAPSTSSTTAPTRWPEASSARTRLIGMLVADILNPYPWPSCMAWKPPAANTATAWWCNTDRDDEQERHHLAALQSYNVEGLIVNTLGHHPGELRALHRELPMVLVDRQLAEPGYRPGRPGQRRRRRTGPRPPSTTRLPRHPAGHRTARRHQLADRAGPGLQCLHRPATGARARSCKPTTSSATACAPSASGPGPKALFTCNGVATLCATRQLRDLGCRLFDEVGLLALDELDWYPLVGSGITALAQPTDEIGRTAFERLLARLEGDREPARRVTFPAQLIVRGSTHPRG